MATGSSLTQNYSRSQSEIQGDLHNLASSSFKFVGYPTRHPQTIPDRLDWRQIWGSVRPRKGNNIAETVL
ncbi:hypothetical protein TNCV_1880681 [Trichonephila clavipes]|nr:hypothetical protein TNCV_1880681 [Trichonephila clavipes]